MSSFRRTAYSLISGIILSLGWYEWGSGLFLLVGFLPLLFVEDSIEDEPDVRGKGRKVFLYASIAFLSFNACATWWIYNASFVGLVLAFLVTTLLMTVPFWLYSLTKRNMGRFTGYISLIIFWLAYEFSYTHGEISWPWLTLGNGFSFDPKLIQWYELTGTMGGSFWILLTNIVVYELVRHYLNNDRKISIPLLTGSLALIAIPVTTSLIRYYTYHEVKNPREIVVVQPNIDPYLKFNDIPPLEQTRIQVSLAAKAVTPSTDYVACPETSIMDNIWIDQIKQVPDIQMVKNLVEQHGKLKYITGIMCYQHYTADNKTVTASPIESRPGYWFDTFNSAIQIDTTPEIPIYHKSKLVTGVEKMPYPGIMKILKPLTLRLGGTFRSEGTQKEREVFRAKDDSVAVAPVICYESVYGEFVTQYIKKGANIIFVITNDGWWGNTPGHRQHNALSSIRAIETRRSVARSANTGISSFIDQRGDVLEKLTWWKRGALRHDLNLNDHVTFYVKHGDFIARTAFYLSVIMLLITFYGVWKNRKSGKQ